MLAIAALALSIPLHFEPNPRPAEPVVRYVAVAPGYRLALSDTSIEMQFARGGSLRMNLPPTWPGGADLVVYADHGAAEYDWLVAPGADPSLIHFSFTGPTHIRVDADGDLVMETPAGEVRHRRPFIYQLDGRQRHQIAGGFLLDRDGQVSFGVAEYDRHRTLVIDPKLVYATGFGGRSLIYFEPNPYFYVDAGAHVAVDRAGNAYITGTTYQLGFPLVHALLPSYPLEPAGTAMFVAKVSPEGSTLLYATYLTIEPQYGSSFGESQPLPGGIAVDANGNAFITGTTAGEGFATIAGGAAKTAGGHDAFLIALDPNGGLLNSLLFGGRGDDAGTSIALGPDGNLYLTGITQSPNFPTTPGAYRTAPVSSQDIFLMKINPRVVTARFPGAQPVVYSTYLGPGNSPVVAADASGNAYVADSATSGEWSTTPGVVQPKCAGETCADVLALKINATGSKLLYATYFGGSGMETVGGLAVDAPGNAYISGTTSSMDLPVTSGAFQASWTPPAELAQTAFVAKLSPDASKLIYSTFLGGSDQQSASGVAVDAAGDAYVSGATSSTDFPLANAVQVTLANPLCYFYNPGGSLPFGESYCSSAGFLGVLNPEGNGLLWSTFLGSPSPYLPSNALPAGEGIGSSANAVALDNAGNVYVTGQNIDVTGGTLGASAGNNIGVAKIAPQGNPIQFSGPGLANSASFSSGLTLPGGLASLFVHGLAVNGTVIATGNPLPTEVEGVSVLVGGIPAPILAVANIPVENPLGLEQINFQVPVEAQTNEVELRYNGISTFATPQVAAPGIFASGDGSGIIQHAGNYSLVTPSNPAVPGEALVIYATGLGLVSPPMTDGVPAPGPATTFPQPYPQPSVTIGGTPLNGEGVSATILYSGVTPGYVGLYQLNVIVPAGIPSGPTSLYITWPSGWWMGAGPGNSIFSNVVTVYFK